MSKVLVTGGAGFIGSNLVDALIDAGYEVDVVDNLSTGKEENLNPKAKFIKYDIRDEPFWYLVRHEPYRYVFHTAAMARIQPSIKDPILSNQHNVDGTLEVLEFCRFSGAKLIFSSSSSVFSGEETPTKEDSPKKPRNPYALQKLINEQYIDLYRDLYGISAVTLRYFNVYGERQLLEGAYTTVLGVFLKQKSEGLPLTITGDGEQRRDFTYVGDVVRANLMAIDWEGDFNIGRGKNYSVNQIADMVGGEKIYIDARLGEVKETLADNTKAQLEGWHPKQDIKDWINENS